MYDFSSRTGLIFNDAGAANIIVAALKNNIFIKENIFALFSGPAEKIWIDNLPDIKCNTSIENILDNTKKIYVGTGWMTDVEYNAIKYSVNKEKEVIAIIDHWLNYEDRFIRKDIVVKPNKYLVTDKYAFEIAKKYFCNEKIVLEKNFYLSEQVERIKKNRTNLISKNILYLCEPIRNKLSDDLDEFSILNKFLLKLDFIDPNNNIQVTLRPHPSEETNKYKEYCNLFRRKISISRNDLIKDLSSHNTVCGYKSYALIIAKAAGINTYSSGINNLEDELIGPFQGIMDIDNIKFTDDLL